MTEPSLQQWLQLYFQEALPPRLLDGLVLHFGCAARVLSAPDAELRAYGLGAAQIDGLHRSAGSEAVRHSVDQALAWGRGAEQYIIVRTDPRYPPLLKEIHDPPLLLFVVGQPEALLRPQIAIVGSRRCSVDGRRNTHSLARGLVAQGFSICSGLARGIDGAAHEAALEAAGVTVAVMGTGADQVYPLQHRKLACAIRATGALVSELPLGSGAIASHFPKRNRIISGMSLGLVVVEAAPKSGTLISARLAMEQNRELFAVPGSIRNPLALGPHRLIQQGAHLIDSPEQIAEHLQGLLGYQLTLLKGIAAKTEELEPPAILPPDQVSLLEAMGFDPVSVETLVERTALPLNTVQTTLLNLELQGVVKMEAGHYVLS
jgi:DNA processing protein